MIQGTASSVGKSLTATGLCRIFRQDGFSAAPFKSQNMALNSFITREGLEMGRAQVAQAEAAGVEPSVLMNPILLKPTGDAVCQVIVNGEVVANMPAVEYYRRKREFMPAVKTAYQTLAEAYDIIVIEGAGSPAEINLRDDDIVNMGMAAIADAPVLLVGDIDRGGVFASIYGTMALLEPDGRTRIKGTLINKFRGDVEILRPGLRQIEELTGVPVVGVVPWVGVDIDDEDSVSSRFSAKGENKPLDAAVIKLPRIANFTDFNALERHPAFGVRYVESPRDLGRPDLLLIPGTKNTMPDLAWMRQNGLEAAIKRLSREDVPIIGVCGGFQMLGRTLDDPHGVESGGSMRGMELLPVDTVFAESKTRTRVSGVVNPLSGFHDCLAGCEFDGYEIHMGTSILAEGAEAFASLNGGGEKREDGAAAGNVLGTYVHGLFDSGTIATRLAQALPKGKGLSADDSGLSDRRAYKERQYDLLADTLRSSIDMDAVYRILGVTAPRAARRLPG
jgi:adenosylcobyric acid synthase